MKRLIRKLEWPLSNANKQKSLKSRFEYEESVDKIKNGINFTYVYTIYQKELVKGS